MIAKHESLFVIMDAFNMVCRRLRTEKVLSHSHAGRVAESFSNKERFEYIFSLHFFNDDAVLFGRNFSSNSSHLRFHDDSSMSTKSWLSISFPCISIICWYASLSSGILVITVGIKNKSFEAECDNLVNLNSGSLINLSMKGIANTRL